MDFSTLKAITIPEGIVTKIMNGTQVLWEKVTFKNVLPLATDTDRETIYGEDYNGDGKNDGYIKGYRLSSSGGVAVASHMYASGFIFPIKHGDIVRIKGIKPYNGTTASYFIVYDDNNVKTGHFSIGVKNDKSDWTTTSPVFKYENGIIEIPLNDIAETYLGTNYTTFRFSAGTIDENTIVTINQEIPA